MKYKYAIAIFALALLVSACSEAKSGNLSETFDVKPGGTLTIDSDSGSLLIQSHASNTVELVVENKSNDPDAFEVTFSSDGRDVRIDGERERSLFSYGTSVRFLLKVPQNYNLDLDTGGGSISVENLRGNVDAKTSGGSIKLGKITGDVEVKTSGGSIRVEEVAGNINGHTSGGSIRATISKQPTQDCRLTTSGGSVTAYLAASIKVDLDASTSGGRVRSEFEVDGSVGKRSIEGKINGGGPDLYLKTSGGSVNIKEI